jgi:6-pyruvoyltetrahydropterin/6-carboxytetrahydropterin synthase
LIHGHNWAWDITFICAILDENGFVIDVGKLDKVKEFLVNHFDHTLLINSDDPQLDFFREVLQPKLSKVVLVPNCGMEGLAKFVYEKVGQLINLKSRELRVVEVTCWEDSKNRATYRL